MNSGSRTRLFTVGRLRVGLRGAFGIGRTGQRFVVAGVGLLLGAGQPCCVVHASISSFFRSVPRRLLGHVIVSGALLSRGSGIFIGTVLGRCRARGRGLASRRERNVGGRYNMPHNVNVDSLLSRVCVHSLSDDVGGHPRIVFCIHCISSVFVLLTRLPRNGGSSRGCCNSLSGSFGGGKLGLGSLASSGYSVVSYAGRGGAGFRMACLNCELGVFKGVSRSRSRGAGPG